MQLVDFALLLAINAGVALGATTVLWLTSIPLRDVSIIDMFFAVILSAIALVSYGLADGFPTRKQLVLALVLAWALRITLHLLRRNWGHGEDPRYTKLRSWAATERAFHWLSLKKVFTLQGVVLWFASLPVQFAMFAPEPTELGWLAWLGASLWLLGFLCEAIADHQLTVFRAEVSNRGTVLNTGLWRYSRHPNYFGELCVWWGIFLIACENPLGWLTVVGPLVYSYLVVNVTGQRTLDKKLAREKPGYAQYMASTSGLVPLPSRRRP